MALDDVITIADISRKYLPDPKIFYQTRKNFRIGMTLINNEIKDIMKVIKSLENKGILLKGTATKITSQEGGFFLRNFLDH